MIEFVKGRLAEKYPTHVVIESGGLGYQVLITLQTFSKLEDKEECKLYAHLSVSVDVRSGQSLYQLFGFATTNEREIFRLLTAVSGVSATIARTVLSSLSAEELKQAVFNEDTAVFKQVKGVGPKLASKIIGELQGKLDQAESSEKISIPTGNTKSNEALSALIALGFDRNMARKAISKAMQEKGNDLAVEELIKESLRQL